MNDILNVITAPSLRPALEVLALVLSSALVGFFIARAMYRTKVAVRTDQLRLEQTRWRRRLSQSSTSVAAVSNERERAQRKLRRARADNGRMAGAAANKPAQAGG
jgi:hypothetical protein